MEGENKQTKYLAEIHENCNLAALIAAQRHPPFSLGLYLFNHAPECILRDRMGSGRGEQWMERDQKKTGVSRDEKKQAHRQDKSVPMV